MKFKEDRPFANPEAAMAKLLEIANGLEAAHVGRIAIGAINHDRQRKGLGTYGRNHIFRGIALRFH